MAWTNINKPSANTYTNVNPVGKEQYDQPNLTYDDTSTFYDGVNQSAWTNLAKPITGDTWAQATYTWASTTQTWGSPNWSPVAKPI